MIDIEVKKEVGKMLVEFNEYFSYLHGKTDTVTLTMPPAAVAVWEKMYSKLTADERRRAKEAVYNECSFHPTPRQFAELVRGNEDTEALNDWMRILDALRMSQDEALKVIKMLAPAAQKALRVVGGLTNLGMMPEDRLHKSIKEDFCRSWKMMSHTLAPHELETMNKGQNPDISHETAKQIMNKLEYTFNKL